MKHVLFATSFLALSACVSQPPTYPDSLREPASAADASYTTQGFACSGQYHGQEFTLSSNDRVLKVAGQTFGDSDVYGLKGEEGWSGKGIVFEVTDRKNEMASGRTPASAKNCEASTTSKVDVTAKVLHRGSESKNAPFKEGDQVAMNCVEQTTDMAACPIK